MSEIVEAEAPAVEPGAPRGEATELLPLKHLRREIWALSWPVILSFALDSILLARFLSARRLE